MDIGEDADDQHDRPDHISLIAQIVGDRASDGRRGVMIDFVARLLFGGALEKEYRQADEYGNRDPIVDSFQFGFPIVLRSRKSLCSQQLRHLACCTARNFWGRK